MSTIQFPSPQNHILPHQIMFTYPQNSSGKPSSLKRVMGALFGLAVGDVLGVGVGFRSGDCFGHCPVTGIKKGGTQSLNPGQWTDNTSMCLCLASSFITKKSFDPYNQMVRYKWWFKKGFLSSTGQCFNINNATRQALDEFCRRQDTLKKAYHMNTDDEVDDLSLEKVRAIKKFNLKCGSTSTTGSGVLMYLAPIPLFYFRSPEYAVNYAGRSASLFQDNIKVLDACRYYAALIVAAIRGEKKERLLDNHFYEDHRSWFGAKEIHPEILRIAQGSYKRPRGYEDGIRGKGYIVDTLEAALWVFCYDNNSFEKGFSDAVRLGENNDTTAIIYGQLAGAYYGYQQIPECWLRQLYASSLIACVGHWLHLLGQEQSPTEQESPKLRPKKSIPTKNHQRNHQKVNDITLASNETQSTSKLSNNSLLIDIPYTRTPHAEIPNNHHVTTTDNSQFRYPYSDSILNTDFNRYQYMERPLGHNYNGSSYYPTIYSPYRHYL
ncbi:unnamed protein product [Rotaria magnacalcarata]